MQPRLSFVGSGAAQKKFYRSRQVLLETEIETFGCTTYVLSYRWHFYLQNSCLDLDENNRVVRISAIILKVKVVQVLVIVNLTMHCCRQ